MRFIFVILTEYLVVADVIGHKSGWDIHLQLFNCFPVQDDIIYYELHCFCGSSLHEFSCLTYLRVITST